MNKIAILGFGIEGKSAYDYLSKKYPESEIDVFDENQVEDSVVKITTIKSFLDINFAPYETIVRSPSVRPDKIEAKIISDKNGSNDFNLTSATQIFFDECPATIIGVTGTKGKGTTASFIDSILRAHFASAGLAKNVYLVGNIGNPALDDLPKMTQNDVAVYELSSFQLWDLKRRSPHIAVLTLIEPDHLDVHTDFDEYVSAKTSIVRFQKETDFVIYNPRDEQMTKIAESSKAQELTYPDESLRKVIAGAIQLPGEYNVENAMAAVLAVRAFDDKISDEAITKGISKFEGLPHRLKLVREVGGVKYYDNSIATTPGSAISSIKSFKEPKILILGGSEKGSDYTELGQELAQNNVKAVYAIGDIRDRIVKQISKDYHGEINLVDFSNMYDLVKEISNNAQSGDVVILAPAAASFGLFKNYKDRGEKFINAVKEL